MCALDVAAKLSLRLARELEAGFPSELNPAEIPAIADRHTARPWFRDWRPRSTGQAAIAAEVAELLASAQERAAARIEPLGQRVLAVWEPFALAALAALKEQPGMVALFAGALTLAGVRAADDDVGVTVQRFRAWLTGGDLHLPEQRAGAVS